MQLINNLKIKSYEKIKEFLFNEHIGRIATIDEKGFPQVIPMNFVFLNDSVYMHSHVRGEKLDNIVRDGKSGFEVDRELEFLPSYFSDPHDASLADTLYISVVIKGIASIISNRDEKTLALNGLMKKYQPEGRYDPITPNMKVLDAVAIIKITPDTINGKYKIGQNLSPKDRMDLAQKILDRRSANFKETLEIMGFEITDNELKMVNQPKW